jgi:hypothetical protein
MFALNVTVAQAGFKGRRAKYRVVVAAAEVAHLVSVDGRSAAARAASKAGKYCVSYVRGGKDTAVHEGLVLAQGMGLS